jgi:hypothetical protein
MPPFDLAELVDAMHQPSFASLARHFDELSFPHDAL